MYARVTKAALLGVGLSVTSGTRHVRVERPVFPCGVECIKTEAVLQGADVLTSLDNLKYSMDVQYSAAADAGHACGRDNVFPAFQGLSLNPSAQLKLTTRDTRETPRVIFECTPGKSYHLVLNDALGGAFQAESHYNHWVKLNIECTDKGWAEVEDSGVDINQGTPGIEGWYSGAGYLPPAFPYNAFHHFNFFMFETDQPFTDARVEAFNTELPANNILGGKAWTIAQLMEALGFTAPVARTWMDVTTSYWSKVRMQRIEAYVGNLPFYQLICPCNVASSWPGLYHEADKECNL